MIPIPGITQAILIESIQFVYDHSHLNVKQFCLNLIYRVGGIYVFCPKCGKQLLEGAKFCSSCGCEITEIEPIDSNKTYTIVVSAGKDYYNYAANGIRTFFQDKAYSNECALPTGELLSGSSIQQIKESP